MTTSRPLVPTLADERFRVDDRARVADRGARAAVIRPDAARSSRCPRARASRSRRRGPARPARASSPKTRTRAARAAPSPMRDVRTLRTLALLDLESHPPSAAIDRVTIVIDPTPGRVLQHTLFTRAHPTPEQLRPSLARLGALMGQDRSGAPALVDSYRPGAVRHGAVSLRITGQVGQVGAGRAGGEEKLLCLQPTSLHPPHQPYLPSAVRRCRHPVPARRDESTTAPMRVTTDRRGFAGGTVIH